MNVNRQVLARLRNIGRRIPFVWPLYRLYWQARRWREARRPYAAEYTVVDFGAFPPPSLENPVSQLCTSEQLMSPTFDRWCAVMQSPPRFSRKQWEFAYILQALERDGMLASGKSGIGFGCGREPLAGLFAQRGCTVLATDLGEAAAQDKGWIETMQHAASLDALYGAAKTLVDRDAFYERVSFRPVDMNAIPRDLDGQFDFTWSACSLEHLGSLRHGMEFIENSVRCLRPGGVAVHTTEFNLSSRDETFETEGCSVYRERDIRQLIAELEAEGHEVAPLNLDTGGAPVDRYVDVPPYGFSPHLKLLLEGYVVTSLGIIIRKRG